MSAHDVAIGQAGEVIAVREAVDFARHSHALHRVAQGLAEQVRVAAVEGETILRAPVEGCGGDGRIVGGGANQDGKMRMRAAQRFDRGRVMQIGGGAGQRDQNGFGLAGGEDGAQMAGAGGLGDRALQVGGGQRGQQAAQLGMCGRQGGEDGQTRPSAIGDRLVAGCAGRGLMTLIP